MPSDLTVRLKASYDKILHLVKCVLVISEIPEIISMDAFLISRLSHPMNESILRKISFDFIPGVFDYSFSFRSNIRSYNHTFVRVVVHTSYDDIVIDSGINDEFVEVGYSIDKPKLKYRDISIDTKVDKYELYSLFKLPLKEVSDEVKDRINPLVMIDFVNDRFDGEGDLIYGGGGSRLVKTSNGYIVQNQNEPLKGPVKYIESRCRNLIKSSFELFNGRLKDWKLESKVEDFEYKLKVVNYPFDFVNSLVIDFFNFAEKGSFIVLESKVVPISNNLPLVVSFFPIIVSDRIYNGNILSLDIETITVIVNFYDSSMSYMSSVEFEKKVQNKDRFVIFVDKSLIPLGSSYSNFAVKVGPFTKGDECRLILSVPELSQSRSVTTPVLDTREGDVYAVVKGGNINPRRGSVVAVFNPYGNNDCCIFDFGAISGKYIDKEFVMTYMDKIIRSPKMSMRWLDDVLSIVKTDPLTESSYPDGSRFLIESLPEVWSVFGGHANEIAELSNGSYRFYRPSPGEVVYVISEETAFVFDGSKWSPFSYKDYGDIEVSFSWETSVPTKVDSNYVVDENLTDLVDGNRDVFYLSHYQVMGTLRVFVDGYQLTSEEYFEIPGGFVTKSKIREGSSLEVSYRIVNRMYIVVNGVVVSEEHDIPVTIDESDINDLLFFGCDKRGQNQINCIAKNFAILDYGLYKTSL